MSDPNPDTPGLAVPPPVLYFVPLAIGLGVNRLFPRPILPRGMAAIVGVGLLVLALVGFAGMWAMRRAGTSPNPYRPTTALVIEGPYRFTRNPMYLGFTLIYLGVTAWVNSLWPLLPLPLILLLIQTTVIAKEEAYLERKFGEPYRQYRRRVRRWI
jgi:protein-S-isoprenylcysteine O-methyltransferase Ste14